MHEYENIPTVADIAISLVRVDEELLRLRGRTLPEEREDASVRMWIECIDELIDLRVEQTIRLAKREDSEGGKKP